MTPEEFFDHNARLEMSQWDLRKFKKSHPILLKVIIKSMEGWKRDAELYPGAKVSEVIVSHPRIRKENQL
jgi:hypothetical protein